MNERLGSVRRLAAAACVWLSVAGAVHAEGFKIVSPGGPIGPGGHVRLQTMPPANGVEERWQILRGPGTLGPHGLYSAPYAIWKSDGDVTVRVIRGPKGSTITAQTDLTLQLGAFPGAQECRGSEQTALPLPGEFVFVDQLPETISKPPPQYPADARARGLEGSLIVNALVCRSGNVLDAYVTWPAGAAAAPSLERAALSAVRQWTFRPAQAGGNPVAVWVAVPLRLEP